MTPQELGIKTAWLDSFDRSLASRFNPASAGNSLSRAGGMGQRYFQPLDTSQFAKNWGILTGQQSGGGQTGGGGMQAPAYSGTPLATPTMNPAAAPGMSGKDIAPFAQLGVQMAGQRMAPQLAKQVVNKMPGMLARGATAATGPLGTPINAGLEGLDAVGALPEWLGGDGLGNVGWSPDREFDAATSMGEGSAASAPFRYAGAALNAWNKPVRSTWTAVPGGLKSLWDIGRGWWQGRDLDQRLAELKRQRALHGQPTY